MSQNVSKFNQDSAAQAIAAMQQTNTQLAANWALFLQRMGEHFTRGRFLLQQGGTPFLLTAATAKNNKIDTSDFKYLTLFNKYVNPTPGDIVNSYYVGGIGEPILFDSLTLDSPNPDRAMLIPMPAVSIYQDYIGDGSLQQSWAAHIAT
jgi:hypothetical protein